MTRIWLGGHHFARVVALGSPGSGTSADELGRYVHLSLLHSRLSRRGVHGPQRTVLDNLPIPTDQMLPEVTACPLRARSDGTPGEFTVTPGEANTAPELGRTSSPNTSRRPSKQRVAGSSPAGRAHAHRNPLVSGHLSVSGAGAHEARTGGRATFVPDAPSPVAGFDLAHLGPGQLADRIGERPLPLACRVQVDQRRPGARMAHALHQLAQVRIRFRTGYRYAGDHESAGQAGHWPGRP